MAELVEQPSEKKSRSIHDVNEEKKRIHNTLNNTYEMFPVGSRVMVICVAQDFRFFEGKEVGTVAKNSGQYLGISVVFDYNQPFCNAEFTATKGRGYADWYNFEATDLLLLDKHTDCSCCEWLLEYIKKNHVAPLDKKKLSELIDLLKTLL